MDKQDQKRFFSQVQKNYNVLSRIYDLLSGRAEQRIVSHALRELPFPQPCRLLDIGCGTGRALVEKGNGFSPQTRMVGVDLALGMCQSAQRKIERNRLDACIDISCANALHLPFSDGVFDLVMMNFTFEIFPDDLLSSLLSECRRMLNPSGAICVVSMADDKRGGWMLELYRKMHQKFSQVIDCRPLDSAAILRANGFHVCRNRIVSLFGLPVAVVQASA